MRPSILDGRVFKASGSTDPMWLFEERGKMARPCGNLWTVVESGGSRQLHFYLQQELSATGQRARITGIIIDMGMVRISEAELARDLHAVLAKVQQGIEVVVEQDHRPVAVIKPSQDRKSTRLN